jgi:hypothetical protein
LKKLKFMTGMTLNLCSPFRCMVRMLFDPILNLYKTPLLCTVFQVYRGLLSTIVHPVTFH